MAAGICASYRIFMTYLLRRLFSCRHLNALREHREDGWYLACADCGHASLLNPRDREMPKAIGRYDERKAVAAKLRAEKAVLQRRAVAARLSESVYASRPVRANVLPLRSAK
jgi:hypothetical protein